ncbi:signal peptidase I [Planococcus sp. N028]|uniref:Signal peptidase I n=1 Tax=Planococcus shixiaomingii TaxID=3058393 RepID=A0ABT8N0Q8_9BACL|nr:MULTISPECIES: signal peptidase I [unclassified Planococcus (in: firmicutes)]MDN7241267.1 signal peptidase I [Planococcus sp. N028]WKA53527.1 signal peptidase I [Planococcus sp. N022]
METEPKKKNEVWEWSKALLIAFGLAAIIRFFFFTPIVVDGESMMPTLEHGDRMIVNKIGYNIGEPDRFDIVVFHAPEEKDYIKRIIGLPGDHVAYEDDQLYINGEPVDEPYLDYYKEDITGTLTEDFTLEEIIGEETIPEGHVFVMGDNRRASKDSRMIGEVPIDEVIGSTSFVFWPMAEAGVVN